MKGLKLIPAQTHIRFIRLKNFAFLLSLVAIIASAYLLATRGLNFGIDFTGGIVIEARTEKPLELAPLRQSLSTAIDEEIALQHFGNDNDIMVRIGQTAGSDETARAALVEQAKTIIAEHNPSGNVDFRKVDFVGPQVGNELIHAGAMALGLAFAAILVYIWLRFEWQFGVGAVLALIHDTLITLGLFSFLQLEFNLTSIAAILTIIGYSINDSVVIYDRIRENLRKYKKKPIPELLDLSINDTMSRTILTAGTTAAALAALVVWGGNVIYGFSLSVLFGVVIGTYSSIYIAAPVLVHMGLRQFQPNNDS